MLLFCVFAVKNKSDLKKKKKKMLTHWNMHFSTLLYRLFDRTQH